MLVKVSATVNPMRTFHLLVVNTLVASVTNNFLWFALTFWVYLETRSVLATAVIGGGYMLLLAVSGIVVGTFVDQHRRRTSMLLSSALTLAAFVLAGIVYLTAPAGALQDLGQPAFWAFITLVLAGAIAGNLRNVALATTVTLLVPEDGRDRANGLVGTANGVAFALTSVFSGLAVGLLGMGWCVAISIALSALTAAHLLTIRIDEPAPEPREGSAASLRPPWCDPRGPPGAGSARPPPLHDLQQLPRRRVHGADGPVRPDARVGRGVGNPACDHERSGSSSAASWWLGAASAATPSGRCCS